MKIGVKLRPNWQMSYILGDSQKARFPLIFGCQRLWMTWAASRVVNGENPADRNFTPGSDKRIKENGFTRVPFKQTQTSKLTWPD